MVKLPRTRRSGFTLVELLVVIGIIAVLVSMLLPALTRARISAQMVTCAAQLRQIALATINYANDNKGRLPPLRFDTGSRDYDLGDSPARPGIQQSNFNYIYTTEYTAVPWTDPSQEGAGIDRLVKKNYLKGEIDKLAVCPSADRTQRLDISRYYFNPNTALRTNSSGNLARQIWWKRINKHGIPPKGTVTVVRSNGQQGTYAYPAMRFALVSDPVFDLAFSSHAAGKFRGWNLAYADGSVKTVLSDSRVARATGGFYRFQDLFGFLQYNAEGIQGVNSAAFGSLLNKDLNAFPVNPPEN